MELTKLLLDWTASIAWPSVTLVLILTFRRQIVSLLSRLDVIANRAANEAFDLHLGERIKLSFREALDRAEPKTIEDAKAIAREEADKAISVFDLLRRIDLKQHHKDLLLKIAKGGDDGIAWEYGGDPLNSPGLTMSYLLSNALVHQSGDRYVAHPLVREYIFQIHPVPSAHQQRQP